MTQTTQTQRPLGSALEAIGNTPLIRLNRIPKAYGIECDMYAKCEWFNAGGSVKDRIGAKMVEDAEKNGILKPGSTIIEPTSGNTGIGLALAGAIKGYRVIITLPEKMSNEKVDVLKGLGAEVRRTPTEAAWDSPESHIGLAKRLNKEIPNSVILDQYSNTSNPLAHYEGTAEEIYNALDGKIDYFVASAGTGGTITGIARKLKEKVPGVKVIGVDPFGSIIARPESLNKNGVFSYKVEGIGYDFIPKVLDHSLIDSWEKTSDKESFVMARRLIKEEGLLCGGSSGATMVAALRVAKNLKKGDTLVVLFADSVRNYMSKFLSDDWMRSNNFMDEEIEDKFGNSTIADLNLPAAVTINSDEPSIKAVEICKNNGLDQLPVVSKSGELLGMVSTGNILAKISSGKASFDDPVTKVAELFENGKSNSILTPETSLNKLSKYFEKNNQAIVNNKEAVQIVEKIDLIKFMAKQKGFSLSVKN